MKIKSFSWLSIAMICSLQAGIDSDALIVSFAQSSTHLYATKECYGQSLPNEKNFRQRLYWLDQHNPHYFLLDSFQDDFDYYIAVLTDHIKVLENKIVQQKSKFKSMTMVRGVAYSALSALCGAGAYYSYTTRNNANRWPSCQDAVSSAVWVGLTGSMFAAIAGTQFYKAYYHVERLIARLDRDKRILSDLKREKAAKNQKALMNATK